MTMISFKGREFKAPLIRDSYNRRSVMYLNTIKKTLHKIGVHPDDVDAQIAANARQALPAKVEWYTQEGYYICEYKAAAKFAENLATIAKLIDLEVKSIEAGELTVEEFLKKFEEDQEIVQKRKDARELLEVEHDCLDFDLIAKNYKRLAKQYHPDTDTGDQEMFKKINAAHKILKRELL